MTTKYGDEVVQKVLNEYLRTRDAIADSDLYPEQPRTLTVTFELGELRRIHMEHLRRERERK